MENKIVIDKELYPVEKVADIILQKKVNAKKDAADKKVKEVKGVVKDN